MSLWDWAMEVYRRPGAEAAFLELQDEHGQCVPYLLWALWAAAPPEALRQGAAIARPWQAAAIEPLRAARRAAKTPFLGVDDTGREALRVAIKADELQAERLLLEALEAFHRPAAKVRREPRDQLAAAVKAWAGPTVELSVLQKASRPFSGL